MFIPLVIESGGRLGSAALGLIGRLSFSAGGFPSYRAASTTHSLQSTRSLPVKGTSALILACPSSRVITEAFLYGVFYNRLRQFLMAPLSLLVVKFLPCGHLHLPG